jgi:hypothetical protein
MKAIITLCIVTSVLFSSCATVFGGQVTNYQRERVKPDQPSRKIRAVAFAFDVLFFPALIYDFSDCAIYKPSSRVKNAYSYVGR